MACCAVWLYFTHTVLNLGGNGCRKFLLFSSYWILAECISVEIILKKTKEFQHAGIQEVSYTMTGWCLIFLQIILEMHIFTRLCSCYASVMADGFFNSAAEGRISEIVGAKSFRIWIKLKGKKALPNQQAKC